MKYIVTIEALKRTTKEVEADSIQSAEQTIMNMLGENGIESFEFDEMWDSVKISNIEEKIECTHEEYEHGKCVACAASQE